LLILERNIRFKKTTYFLKKHLPKNWKVLCLEDKHFSQRKKISQKKTFLNQVLKYERKNEIKASEASSNYILYYDLIRQLGLEPIALKNYHEIESRFCLAMNKLNKIIKSPPTILFYETIDSPESFIFYKKLSRLGTICLESRFVGLGPLAILPATGLNRKNPFLQKGFNCAALISKKAISLSQKIFNRKEENSLNSSYHTWHNLLFRRTFAKNISRLFVPFYEKWARQSGYFYFRIMSLGSLLVDRKYFQREVFNRRFIVYFLNHLPEASTFSEAPDFADIPSIVLRLARYRPSGVQILIKEHPRTLYKRPSGFYTRLAKIPGVTLLHPSVPNDLLFSRAEAVLVVTGTAGLQAAPFLVPVGVLGRPAWSHAPWVWELNQPEEIYSLQRKDVKSKKQESIRFLARYLDASFPLEPSKRPGDWEERLGKAMAQMLISSVQKFKKK